MGIFGNAFGWPHLIVILVIILLLFGAPKLPALAKSIATSMKIFKTEIKTDKTESTGKADEAASVGGAPVVYTEEPPAVQVAPVQSASAADSGTTPKK